MGSVDRRTIRRNTDPGGSQDAAEVVSIDPKAVFLRSAKRYLLRFCPHQNPPRATYSMLSEYLSGQGFKADRKNPMEACRRELRNLVKAEWLVVSNDPKLKLANEDSHILCEVLMLPPTIASVILMDRDDPTGPTSDAGVRRRRILPRPVPVEEVPVHVPGRLGARRLRRPRRQRPA